MSHIITTSISLEEDTLNAVLLTTETQEETQKQAALKAQVYGRLAAVADPSNGSSSGGGVVLPFDPNSANPYGGVPLIYNSDGTINVTATMNQLQQMLYYAQFGDPANNNIASDITRYVMLIYQNWDLIKPSDRDYVNNFLGQPIVSGDGSTTLGSMLVTWIYQGYFYQSGGDQATANAEALAFKQAVDQLAGRDGGSGWIQDLADAADDQYGTYGAWMSQHTGPNGTGTDQTFSQFCFWQGLNWESLSMSSQMSAWQHNAKETDLNQLIAEAGGNMSLLLVMLMAFMCGDNDDKQIQVGGLGNTNSLISNMGGSLNSLLSTFQGWSASSPPTAAQAQQFMTGLVNFLNQSGDLRLSSISPQIQATFQSILGLSTNSAIMGPNGQTLYPAGTSLQTIFNDTKTGGQFAGNYQYVAQAFGQWMPAAPAGGGPIVIPQQWTDMTNDLQQTSMTITSEAQGIGVDVQNLQGQSDKELAFIQDGLSVVTDFIKFINTLIQSSNS